MDMDTVWEKTKRGLKDGATMSVEYTKIGKLKVDGMALKGKIKRNYRDIGERYYDLAADGRAETAAGDLAIKKYVENITKLYAEIDDINTKIKEISRALKAEIAAPAATATCAASVAIDNDYDDAESGV